ncbi:MAG: pyridine nucleotide-disulfide oxidoreductase [Candidatus Methanomethylicota archaeon]|uniref:Pyridine nucleotide-disulfide oxidoreductase n=1 Tax=Thermoproteota archaeon TaxID=2056631 RepID=A0A497EY32_9CREN|nr:MAG: pyridine nucleotide-disulfide oxidoreductase [Candidatus Verstraetearchaeota archaeon]
MSTYDIVIVGGGPAGFVTALTAKRMYPDKKVCLIRKVCKAPIPCGIPYIFGTLRAVEKNIIPDAPLLNAGVEIVIDEVASLMLKDKKLKTRRGVEISFDKLVLATGSKPAVPKIEGVDLDGVFFMRKDVNYLNRLLSSVNKARNIVIVGGGFIGVELADELSKLNKNVTIVELLPHCLMLTFDEEFCTIAEKKLRSLGVNIITNARVTRIKGEEVVKSVELSDGRELPADLVIVAVGARPNSDLARESGLKIGAYGGVVVDDFMRTSEPDVFAVGDCAEKYSFFTGRPVPIMLASIATAEARVAAASLYGPRLTRGITKVVGIFSTAIRDLALGAAGLTEKMARREGFDIIVGKFQTVDRHPGALPGASKLTVKLVFSRDGIIMGGEVAGGVSVGEITNIIGLAIQNRMTASELATMQFGTHPLLTAAPTVYPIVMSAFDALHKM